MPAPSTPPPHLPAPRAARLGGSLKARMALVLGLVLFLPAAWAVWQAFGVYQAQGAREAATLKGAAARVAARQAELLAQARATLERVAARPELAAAAAPAGDPAPCMALLAAEAAGSGGLLAGLAAADARGRAFCASRPGLAGLELGGRPWFRELAEAAPGAGGAYAVGDLASAADAALGRAPVLAVPLPRPADGGGGFAGTLSGDLDPARLAAAAGGLELPGGAVAFLLDRVAQTAPAPAPPSGAGGAAAAAASLPGWDAIARLLADPLGAVSVVEGGPAGRARFTAAPVEPDRLHALVGLPAPRWSWLERDLLIGVIAPVAMLALAVTGIWIATDYLVNRHVQALALAARDYALARRAAGAGGGAHAGWPALEGAPDELRQLASVLAGAAGELDAREAELEASLAQKEALLREIHHRVKNNLQVVTSLLNLRAQAAASPAARGALFEAQARVKALALVHRGLYEEGVGSGAGGAAAASGAAAGFGSVELRPLLAELCALLEDAAPGRGSGGVEVRLRLEPARVAVDRAVPVALFATEALSNALRHGFPDGRGGAVTVRLAAAATGAAPGEGGDGGAGTARLTISDDGVGLGGAADGLGLRLMRMLARQAGGRLALDGAPDGGGTRVELEFPLAVPPAAAPAAPPAAA